MIDLGWLNSSVKFGVFVDDSPGSLPSEVCRTLPPLSGPLPITRAGVTAELTAIILLSSIADKFCGQYPF